MSVEHMPDERLSHFYENIRQQVEADRANKHQFMANPTVRRCADRLRSEMAAIEPRADRVALAVSDPTRSLADPGALDLSTNSGRLSLCRLPRMLQALFGAR